MSRKPGTATNTFEPNPVSITPWAVPDFWHPGEPTALTIRVAERIKALKPGEMALFAEHFQHVPPSDEMPQARFIRDETLAEGRTASKQEVVFGRIAVWSRFATKIVPQVAMKPYDSRKVRFNMTPQRAIAHDMAASALLNRVLPGSAYVPIGVWRKSGSVFIPGLITEYNPRTTSLDNIFLADRSEHGTMVPSRELASNGWYLGHVGLGFLHGLRISHGDAFPQNLASQGTKDPFFNDTTSFRPFASSTDTTRGRIIEDISDFADGALVDPDKSSEEMRHISANRLLDSGGFRDWLYRAYIAGAKAGARAAGYAEAGLVVGESDHRSAIDLVVEQYVEKYGRPRPGRTFIT